MIFDKRLDISQEKDPMQAIRKIADHINYMQETVEHAAAVQAKKEAMAARREGA